MSDFQQSLERWHDFFTLTGGMAATLLGLLFVAVSLRPDIRAEEERGIRRQAVGRSFLNYLCVLLFSLYFLVPDMEHDDLGWTILITCLFPIWSHGRSFARLWNSPGMSFDNRFWVYLVPIACYVAGIGVAIALIGDDDTEIAWFLPIVALLLTVPTRNAWELVLGSHESG